MICYECFVFNSVPNFEIFYPKVPKDFDFLQTMDLFYKIHRVFIVQFHADLKQFLAVFDQCVFGLGDRAINLTSMAKELKVKLFAQNSESIDIADDFAALLAIWNDSLLGYSFPY